MINIFLSNSLYMHYKSIYDKKGLFALLSAFFDFIYNCTTSLKSHDILNIFIYYVICFYAMLYVNFFLFSITLLISTIVLLSFAIITLFKHILNIDKKLQPLQFWVCVLLCLILFIILLCLWFILVVVIWPEVIQYLTLPCTNGQSGGSGPGSGGPGDPGGPGPAPGPGPHGPGREEGDHTDTEFPDSVSPSEQRRLDREWRRKSRTWDLEPRQEDGDHTDTEFPDSVSPGEQRRLDREWERVSTPWFFPWYIEKKKREKNAHKNDRHRAIRTEQMKKDDAYSSWLSRTGQLPPKS